MSVQTALWRMTQAGPVPVSYSALELEATLEDLIVADPTMVGLDVLIIGRQVHTAVGGFIDILALDSDAQVHVIELKRGRAPRDVVAQTHDYGSWAASLTLDEVATLYAEHHEAADLEDAFAERFAQPLPDVFNPDQQLTVVASNLDAASDRIIEYLAERFGVPINAVFFRYFEDAGRRYLTRTWLLTPEEAEAAARPGRRRSRVRPWNGRDYYVIQGTADGQRNYRWGIAKRYGLLNAGGSAWHLKPLRNLTPGKRVFAYVGKVGYVGVGRVVGDAQPATQTKVEIDGQLVDLSDAPEIDEAFAARATSQDEDVTEMVDPVEWDVVVDQDEAVSFPGLFASQVTVCKLRDERTIESVEQRFGLE